MALNAKQRLFAQEYLKDLNATQAAIRAGYSPKTAGSQGFDLLKKPEIAEFVRRTQANREGNANATAEDVLREINRLAMFDPADLADVQGPADIKLLSEHVRRAIVGWSYDRQGRFQVKTAKEGALEMLARHHSLFNDKLKLDATVKGQVAYKANIPSRKPDL